MPTHLMSKKTASLMVVSIGILLVILHFVVGLVLYSYKIHRIKFDLLSFLR